MSIKSIQIKNGINVHYIETKFKTTTLDFTSAVPSPAAR